MDKITNGKRESLEIGDRSLESMEGGTYGEYGDWQNFGER